MRLGRWATCIACATVLLLAGTAASAAVTYPVPYSFAAGVAAETLRPGSSPPGSNDWSCHPSAAHPYPVVLVHGTFGDMTDSWQALSPLLANAGYCVFALNYGGPAGNPIQATGDIPTSAAQLASFVSRVLAATGAPQVDIVGHSQGGMMPRWYLKFLGGATLVHTLVGLAPSNHGTTVDGLATLTASSPGFGSVLDALCVACTQQLAGSSFLATLNAGGDTVPGPTYTVIETKYDEVVTPYTSAFLTGPAVTNIVVQQQCATDFADHLAIIYDRVALADVLHALDPSDTAPIPCALVLPGVGG
jgi:triacylglycerol esterase/lipase EstA (alpha/beta hydrolase family)